MYWGFRSADARDAVRSRHAFVRHLRTWADPRADLADAEIAFGELVGNVVRHSPGPIEVRVIWDTFGVTLRVYDEGETFTPDTEGTADPLAECGRGLRIIKALSGGVQVRQRAGRKHVQVWFPIRMNADFMGMMCPIPTTAAISGVKKPA